MTDSKIKRRDFLSRGIKSGLIITGLSTLPFENILSQSTQNTSPSATPQNPSPNALPSNTPAPNMPTVCIVEGEDVDKIVRKSFELMGGFNKFITKGDRVALKPNMAWSRKPEFAANTNPFVMAVLVKLCLEAGAKEVIVTDNTCNNAQEVYSLSGIAQACKDAGAKVFFTHDQHFKEMNINGDLVKKWKVHKSFVDVDKLINVPIAKHHGLSRVSLGMKNWFGAIGGERGQLHQNIHKIVVDLAAFFKPHLTVVDCTSVLMKGGPTGGSLADVKKLNKVVISTDPVAADAIAAEFLNANPAELEYLQIASNKGLGQWDKSKIKIITDKIT